MNKKLAAALMVPVLVAGIGMSKASSTNDCPEVECCSATAIVKATLKEICSVVFESGNCGTNISCQTGALDSPLTPKFKFITNGGNHKLALTAKVEDSSGVYKDALSKEGGKDYIVLGNTKVKPTATAINNCKGGSPASSSNGNCIAYEVKTVSMSGASTGSLSYNSSKSRYETSATNPAKSGTTHITVTTGTTARANTYSEAADRAGDYRAELTLTAYSI